MRNRLPSTVLALMTVFALGLGIITAGVPASAEQLAQTTATPATPAPALDPDLTVTLLASQDPVPSGGELTYTMVIANRGGGAAGATTVSMVIPTGTQAKSVGPGCAQVGGAVICNVQPLAGGATAGFTFTAEVTGLQGSVISATAIVDPSNLVKETDRANNTATITTIVVGALTATAQAPATPLPATPTVTPTPVVIVVTSTPAPVQPTAAPEPAPAPPSVAPAPPEQFWLLVLQPTETYNLDDTPAWVAQPGEWYFALRQDGGWAIAHWEGDTPDWAVWIQLDGRIEITR